MAWLLRTSVKHPVSKMLCRCRAAGNDRHCRPLASLSSIVSACWDSYGLKSGRDVTLPRPWRQYAASAAPEPSAAGAEVVGVSGDEEDDLGGLKMSVGFIGAGAMGEAMLSGWVAAGILAPEQIATSSRQAERQQHLAEKGYSSFGSIAESSRAVAAFADVLVLGVKPQSMAGVLESVAGAVEPEKHLVVSIAAGITVAKMEAALPAGTRVVRVMPNTPIQIGRGASAFCVGNACTPQDAQVVQALLSSVGRCVQLDEPQLDAFTGLAGSGPAYAYLMLEALADGGVRAGLPRAAAVEMAAQTMLGAAQMVLQPGASGGAYTHPAALKDAVASPAGTTIAGLEALEAAGVRGALMQAVKAAADRSRELSG